MALSAARAPFRFTGKSIDFYRERVRSNTDGRECAASNKF